MVPTCPGCRRPMVFKGKKPIMFTNGRAEATYLLETYSQRLLETVALSVIIALRSASFGAARRALAAITIGSDACRVLASITCARVRRKILEFVRLPLPLLPVGRGRFFARDIWPDFCVFRIHRQPLLKPWFAIRLDGIDGTFRFANATVDAFLGMDDEHVLALVEAVDGAHGDAVHGFAANAAIVDDVSQFSTPKIP